MVIKLGVPCAPPQHTTYTNKAAAQKKQAGRFGYCRRRHIQRGARDDLHIAAVPAEESPIQVGVCHRKDVIRAKNDPLKSQAAVAGGIGIKVHVLSVAAVEVPQNLIVGETAQFDIAFQVHVAVLAEVEHYDVPSRITNDGYELTVVFAVGRNVENAITMAVDDVQSAAGGVNGLVSANGYVGPRYPLETGRKAVDRGEGIRHVRHAIVHGGWSYVLAVAVGKLA